MLVFSFSKCVQTATALMIGAVAIAASFSVQAGTIGASLLDALDQVAIDQPIEVIVSFEGNGPLTADQLGVLEALNLSGVYFQALPIAGVLATPEQVLQLSEVQGVRSLWLNEQLAYSNADARALTGVDRMRTDPNLRNAMGMPYSGKGIGVMVNDSGIDATHPDLMLGEQTVQNVFGTTNLNAISGMLPVTWLENVPDTDLGSGHGTHVAGTVGGTGAASGGLHAGVAPGASLVGYGSGAVLLILDTIGAFDYALVNQYRYNIRVINNSWGTPGDTGTDFDPDNPISIATKRLADRNVMIVFAAGNSGSGEDTIGGNYMKAPWIVRVAAGNKNGTLADFSSRGKRGGGGTVEVGGETFEWVDRPTVTAPGVDIISAQATTGALGATALKGPFYAYMSGTSMAAPHVAGIVALMLEANPMLHWSDVINILEATATNMPGREPWEVGAGMVNAYAAVTMAAELRNDFGQPLNLDRSFNATVDQSRVEGQDFELFVSPVGSGPAQAFTVDAGLSSVIASANVSDNTVAIVLTDPDGNRYGSGISLPLLGSNIAVTAPAIPGQWTIEARGIGALSGVALDPLGLTSGVAVPGNVTASIDFMRVDGFTGLNDVGPDHPARSMIETAIAERLMDSRDNGNFRPNSNLKRSELAYYLTMGGSVRQYRPTDGSNSFDLNGLRLATAEANNATGASLRDLHQVQDPVILSDGNFRPNRGVARVELAWSLIQALGLQAQAEAIEASLADQPITVDYQGQRIAIEDDAEVPAGLRGHTQLAIDLELLSARYSLQQGPFDPLPTITAEIEPLNAVRRAEYAIAKVNFHDRYTQAVE